MKRPEGLAPLNLSPYSADETKVFETPDFWAVLRVCFRAWRTEKLAKSDVRNLHSRYMRLQAQQAMAVAEIQAHIHFSDGLLALEARQHELEVTRHARKLNNPALELLLCEEVQREQGFRDRKGETKVIEQKPEVPATDPQPPLSRFMSNDQIKATAQKAVIRMSLLPEADRNRFWGEWTASLSELPELTAKDLINQAKELWRLLQK